MKIWPYNIPHIAAAIIEESINQVIKPEFKDDRNQN
jgi:hypothetical protein